MHSGKDVPKNALACPYLTRSPSWRCLLCGDVSGEFAPQPAKFGPDPLLSLWLRGPAGDLAAALPSSREEGVGAMEVAGDPGGWPRVLWRLAWTRWQISRRPAEPEIPCLASDGAGEQSLCSTACEPSVKVWVWVVQQIKRQGTQASWDSTG